ncbi:Uncharacterized protein conserved in archaea [Archaeoglobus sulfaticallidus PM70-1]|uniref:Uncharacterized protein conserved in archaea n=1 Tax=Archaeoglobus sulfaticallidus PM70-1 TaxID=387631 RepID=N0BB35_9EURY|nr:DUF2240 family protein [Archaeoglobus sulfaticallidus]AGK60819.1 Uncharacterized protein conserved in archaea [Archaeoglobus sulfaticallidus PM70-1]
MLSLVIASAFKSKGKKRMSKSDLTYLLSFDLKWFSHSTSKKVVEEAIRKGLLTFNEGMLEPTFDLKQVDVPVGFKPDVKKIFDLGVFEELVDLISERLGIDKSEVVSAINRKQEEMSNLLYAEVISLIYAKECGIDVKPYLPKLWEEVFL